MKKTLIISAAIIALAGCQRGNKGTTKTDLAQLCDSIEKNHSMKEVASQCRLFDAESTSDTLHLTFNIAEIDGSDTYEGNQIYIRERLLPSFIKLGIPSVIAKDSIIVTTDIFTEETHSFFCSLEFSAKNLPLFTLAGQCKNDTELKLLSIVDVVNENLPFPVDQITYFDSLRYEPGTNMISYYYSVSGDVNNEESITAMRDFIQEAIPQSIADAPELTPFRDYYTKFRYIYFSKDTETQLFDFTAESNIYNNLKKSEN